MPILCRRTAKEPVASAFRLACYCDILSRFSLEIAAFVPVESHVFYELESVAITLVVLGQVGSHLQGAVHGDVECQLACEG